MGYNKKQINWWHIGIAIIFISSLSAAWGLFGIPDIWKNVFVIIVSAAASYLIIALVTDATRNKELNQIRKTKQYEEKLRIYQEFLQKLCDAVKDNKLTLEEKTQIQFQTAYLAMHTNPTHVEKISESVKNIIKITCDENNATREPVKALQKSLFEIIIEMRAELYENDKDEPNYDSKSDLFEHILSNFAIAYDGIEDQDCAPQPQKIEVTLKNTSNNIALPSHDQEATSHIFSHETDTQQSDIWESALKEWTKEGEWVFKHNENTESMGLYRPENDKIHVQFGFWKGHYYIEAQYNDESRFAQELKWKYHCGSKQYSLWWTHIADPDYFNLKEGEFTDRFNSSESMQQTLTKWFNELIAVIKQQDVSEHWWLCLTKKTDTQQLMDNGWSFWYYQWKTLVCDFDRPELGKPFVDLFPEDGKIYIRIGNRDGKREKQAKILEIIDDNNLRISNDNRTDYAIFNVGTPDNDVVSKLIELINKLNK